MRKGFLSDYFRGVAVKKLSAVEADTKRSNQHEFNGVDSLKKILGPEKAKFPAKFVWLSEEQEALSHEGFLTWYDARERHPTRSEYRLYFPTTPVSDLASAGDALFIAKQADGGVMVIITPAGGTIQNQLLWLFGLPDQPELKFQALEIDQQASQLDFAVRYVLDELGVEIEEPNADELDALVARWELSFPKTRDFSSFARSTLTGLSAIEDPDATLLAWMDREEALFRRLERQIVAQKLRDGFMSGNQADVDGFLSFSLSVQNRRKSRVGYALEHHLVAMFDAHGITYSRGAETENRNKPDFIFPGIAEYRNVDFPANRLTMLGAKSTLKDRWRQVLSEAVRIEHKHLLTLEPSISENQTNEMRAKNLRLVIPERIHESFRPAQRDWLITVRQFLELVRERSGEGRGSN